MAKHYPDPYDPYPDPEDPDRPGVPTPDDRPPNAPPDYDDDQDPREAPPETPAPPADPAARPTTMAGWKAWFQALTAGVPHTPAGLASLKDKLAAYGVTITGSNNQKIKLPDGKIIDVILAAGDGGKGWTWDEGGDGPGGKPTEINPDYLAPWTKVFAPGDDAMLPGVPGALPVGEYEWPGEFKPPTAESILSDPSYLFRLDQGRGTVENSAAGRGLLNSGGTLADILNYGQKAASQEYQNIWGRDFNKWGADWQNAAAKNMFGRGLNQDQWGRVLDVYGAAKGRATDSYTRAWNQFLEDKDTWYRNQNEPFKKLYQMAGLGAGASQ